MLTKTFEIPTLYGDHHVLEVRRVLFALPGVTDVYASSAFQTVEVTYDESLTNDLEIAVKLDEAGYLGEWSIPVEIGATTPTGNGKKAFFRHTEVYESTRSTVSFGQVIHDAPKPLWPCPGMGVIKRMED